MCIRGCIYLVYIDLPGHLCMVQLICVHNYLCTVQLMHEILWYVLLCKVATGTLLVVASSRMFVIYLIIPGYPNHCKYFGNKLAIQNETQLHQPELQGQLSISCTAQMRITSFNCATFATFKSVAALIKVHTVIIHCSQPKS